MGKASNRKKTAEHVTKVQRRTDRRAQADAVRLKVTKGRQGPLLKLPAGGVTPGWERKAFWIAMGLIAFGFVGAYAAITQIGGGVGWVVAVLMLLFIGYPGLLEWSAGFHRKAAARQSLSMAYQALAGLGADDRQSDADPTEAQVPKQLAAT